MVKPEFIDASCIIARSLLEASIQWKNSLTWIANDQSIDANGYAKTHSPISSNLYGGSAGIAWFLYSLGIVSGDNSHLKASRKALLTHLLHFENLKKDYGFYTGLCGFLKVCFIISEHSKDEELYSKAVDSLRSLRVDEFFSCNTSAGHDYVGGSSDGSTGIRSLINHFPPEDQPAIFELINRHLVDLCTKGLSALSNRGSQCGLAHGASGIAMALCDVLLEHEFEDHQKLVSLILNLILDENVAFSKSANNWRDIRKNNEVKDPESSVVAWCHGAPGIGLSRAHAFSALSFYSVAKKDIGFLKRDAQISIARTRDWIEREMQSPTPSWSICHGLSGNICAALKTSQLIDYDDHATLQRLNNAISDRLANDILSGYAYREFESLSLMLGKSGLGLYLIHNIETSNALPITHNINLH